MAIDKSDLDDAVYDAACDVASNINNQGVDAQVAFLKECGWTNKEIAEVLGFQ
jgi:hypothetical protein